MGHPYIGLTDEEIRSMLAEMGLSSFDELYRDVPEKLRLDDSERFTRMSEEEVISNVHSILSKNKSSGELKHFIGGGVWPHHIPSVVKEVVRRSEFLTSYTPYQAEASQGVLQALFEYQSLMAELLDIDIVNSSMYDWATALAEAFRMAKRVTRRSKILYPRYISPQRLEVARTYTEAADMNIEEYKQSRFNGTADLEDLKQKISDDVAAVYVELPSYLGFIPLNIREIGEIAHDKKSLFIIGVDPTILGIVEAPGTLGADIVVGEGQPLGIPMSYGGPLLGIMGCKMDRRLVNQMPGRIIGMTSAGEERAYAMILQAREQHIKREKASSNICTNQTLCAIAAAVYLSLLGKEGIRRLGEHILARTKYLSKRLASIDGVEAPLFKAPHFKEFTYRVEGKHPDILLERLMRKGVLGGVNVGSEFNELKNSILTCVTEIHSIRELDMYVSLVEEVANT